MAAVFNAGNNALNQIYDLEIDRVNKAEAAAAERAPDDPRRWIFTAIAYASTLVLAWLVAPGGRHECFWIVLVATHRDRTSTRCRRSAPSSAASGRT